MNPRVTFALSIYIHTTALLTQGGTNNIVCCVWDPLGTTPGDVVYIDYNAPGVVQLRRTVKSFVSIIFHVLVEQNVLFKNSFPNFLKVLVSMTFSCCPYFLNAINKIL